MKVERGTWKDDPVQSRSRKVILHPSSFILAATCVAALSGCGTFTSRPSAPLPPTFDGKVPPAATSQRPGGYYLDDGPGANPPADLDGIPDAVPRVEPVRVANTRPYVAMGVSYRPMTAVEPYKAQGLATWYGRRYHGKPTASGEPYDMYAMTGAHSILPIPSYARVTNLRNGKSVVVRINDRGPFVDGRLIDVSYTAAYKLGILGGATMVEVESIVPGTVTAQAPSPPIRLPERVVVSAPPPVKDDPSRPVSAAAAPSPDIEKSPTGGAAVEDRVASARPVAAAPATVPAARQTPVTTEGGRVFLQLGAFASRENADGFLARVQSQADWLALQIVSRDGLHRVQAGPYASQAEARDSAERVAQALGVKPILQTR